MGKTSEKTVIIAGAGLCGPLMAIYMARRGYRVKLYEKRPDPRIIELDAGKSINLALSVRGINALNEVGLADEVLSTAIPMRGRMMHDLNGKLTFQPYGKDDSEAINSVSRPGLNKILIEAADKNENVEVIFDHKCIDTELDVPSCIFKNEKTGEISEVKGDFIIGADGAHSAVRRRMMRTDRFQYSQHHLEHGYKELRMPAADDGSHRMEKHALHIWPRGHYMMIALANQDGSFTVTCFWPFKGRDSFDGIQSGTDLTRFFKRTFPDSVPNLPDLVNEFFSNSTGSLVTVRCNPHHYSDKAILIGDAAHAVVPFYGQGMNASFEDCYILNQILEDKKDRIEKAFAEYSNTRIENTNAIADLALHNFIEMRDHTASGWFIFTKKLEQSIRNMLPGKFLPLYTMVTFSNIPYAEAVRRSKKQDDAVKLFMVIVMIVLLAVIFVVLGIT
ncbi:MAG TPA: NAD(P)/FAD-dependent oxidoreductase [bacterium]|jgi:kynurenine 3-monooxygenase